jgi:hypothetical protein
MSTTNSRVSPRLAVPASRSKHVGESLRDSRFRRLAETSEQPFDLQPSPPDGDSGRWVASLGETRLKWVGSYIATTTAALRRVFFPDRGVRRSCCGFVAFPAETSSGARFYRHLMVPQGWFSFLQPNHYSPIGMHLATEATRYSVLTCSNLQNRLIRNPVRFGVEKPAAAGCIQRPRRALPEFVFSTRLCVPVDGNLPSLAV